MAEITFKDVEEQMEKSHHYMRLNRELAFDIRNRPKHATWIDNSTLARWFYQASQEWIREYQDKEKIFSGTIGASEAYLLAVVNPRLLNALLEEFRNKIEQHPLFSKDKLMRQALAA